MSPKKVDMSPTNLQNLLRTVQRSDMSDILRKPEVIRPFVSTVVAIVQSLSLPGMPIPTVVCSPPLPSSLSLLCDDFSIMMI